MRRKLARPGDRIKFDYRIGEHLSGVVEKKMSDYLMVKLDKLRELEAWEKDLPGAGSDPTRCAVYLHSDYVIEEAKA